MTYIPLDEQQALELLTRYCWSLKGTPDEIKHIAEACLYIEGLLKHAASAICQIADGKASRFYDPDMQIHLIQELDRDRDSFGYLSGIYYHHDKDYHKFVGNFEIKGLRGKGYREGQRIAAHFLAADLAPVERTDERRKLVALDEALYSLELGELPRAETLLRQLGEETQYDIRHSGKIYYSVCPYIAQQNLVDVLILKGDLLPAEYIVDRQIRRYEATDMTGEDENEGDAVYRYLRIGFSRFEPSGSNPYARRAHIQALRGDISKALQDYKKAEDFQHDMSQYYYRSHSRSFYEATVFYKRDPERREQEIQKAFQPNVQLPQPPLTGQAALM